MSQANLDAMKAFSPEIGITTSNRDCVKDADIVVLAVKPWLVESISEEIESKLDYKKQIIVSIAAGVDFDKLTRITSYNVCYTKLLRYHTRRIVYTKECN